MRSLRERGIVEVMIVLDHVTKSYGGYTALDDVTFTARSGRVTGFLGPNGAGKSTAMRIMVGLTPADAGAATIGGHRYPELPNPGRSVGVLLDASAQHDGRTGREVLAVSALAMGLPAARVEEMLALVGLTEEESRRRVRNYSLGMRQRLGLANALLGDPEVLILDEPANGLDPAGIRWMRGILRGHAERGGTVLLSSHLLHEVQMIADDMVVIGRGRIVARGTLQELLRSGGTVVRAERPERLIDDLAAAGIAAEPTPDGALRTEAEAAAVGRVAAAGGHVLHELRAADGADLEALFLELTSDDARERVGEGVPA